MGGPAGLAPLDGEFGVVLDSAQGTGVVSGQQVALTGASATHNQSGFNVSEAIDGVVPEAGNTANGWAIGAADADAKAVFQTTSPLAVGEDGSRLTFLINNRYVGWASPIHLGHFRLWATTDADPTAADGSIAWTLLDPVLLSATDGRMIAEQSDHSILRIKQGDDWLSGVGTDYYILADVDAALDGITGFRLETLYNDVPGPDLNELPHLGPGTDINNGNFVVSEFQVFAAPLQVPEPGTAALLLLGLSALLLGRRRKRC
jgi:hypothetical protein